MTIKRGIYTSIYFGFQVINNIDLWIIYYENQDILLSLTNPEMINK